MASDNEIEVGFGVDTSGIESGSQKAASAVKNAVGEMKESMAAMTEATLAMKESITAAMEGISAGFEKFNGMLMGLTAALAGTGAIKEFVNDSLKLTSESAAMGKALGISATEASYLKSALAGVGVSSETMLQGANKITMTLVKNEQAFKDLGVATRDSGGHFLNTRDIMEATNAKLREFGEGTDRNVEGMKIYGRAWQDIAPLVSKFKGETEESRAEAEALNLVVGQESVDAMKAYKTAQIGVGEVMEGIKNTIGEALMPRLTAMAEWFKSVGPDAVNATRIAMNGYLAVQDSAKDSLMTLWNLFSDAFSEMGKIIANVMGDGGTGPTAMQVFENIIKVAEVAFIGFGISVKLAVNSIRGSFEQLANVAHLAGTVVAAALHGDWAGIKAGWDQFKADTTKTISDTMDNAVTIATEGREKIDAAIMGNLGAKKPVTKTKGQAEGAHSGDGAGAANKPKSEMPDFKAALQEKLEAEGNYFKDSTAESLAYWQGVKARGLKSIEDDRAVNTEIFNLKKKLALDGKALAEEDSTSRMAMTRASITTEIDAINAKQAAGKMSMAESLAQIKILHDAEYTAEVALLEQKKAILGTSALEAKKIDDELVMLREKNNVTVIKDAAAAAAEVQKGWEKAFAPIVSAMDTAVKGIISGTTTMQKALDNIFNSILATFANMGVKMVADWAVKEATKTMATLAGTEARTAAEEDGAVQSMAISGAAAVKNIMNSAWEAMSAAYKAMAGIPVVGPALAVGAGATAFGAVSGLAGNIASARGGYDIPAGVNPMTQLHEREMVLPRAQADAVRNMADGGGGETHLHVHAIDGASVEKLFKNNGALLTSVMRSQRRNFAF